MKKLTLILIMLFVGFVGQAQKSHDEKVATILYGFNRLLLWPAYPENMYQVDVLLSSPVTDFLNNISISNSTAEYRKLKATQVDVPSNCNVLFVPSNNFGYFLNIFSQLNGRSILIVSDKSGSLEQGADVELYYRRESENDSVLSFKANLSSIAAKNIKTSFEFIGFANH